MADWNFDEINFYISKDSNGEENCLPFNPEEFTVKMKSNNEEVSVVGQKAINYIKSPSLISFGFNDLIFTNPDTPVYKNVSDSKDWSPERWVEFFRSGMENKDTFTVTITGIEKIIRVAIENFEPTKKAGEEYDTYYNIEFKEAPEHIIEKWNVDIKQEIPEVPNGTKNTEGNAVIDCDGWLWGKAFRSRMNTYSGGNKENYSSLYNPIMTFQNPDKEAFFSWLPIKVGQRFNWYRYDPQEKVDGLYDKLLPKDKKMYSNTDLLNNLISYSPTDAETYKKLMKIFEKKIGVMTDSTSQYTFNLDRKKALIFLHSIVRKSEAEMYLNKYTSEKMEEDLLVFKLFKNQEYISLLTKVYKNISKGVLKEEGCFSFKTSTQTKDKGTMATYMPTTSPDYKVYEDIKVDRNVLEEGKEYFAMVDSFRAENKKNYEFKLLTEADNRIV